jgi:hypothetical protein
VILAMGTTGSPDDVAFLTTLLRTPFTDHNIWSVTLTAATTLGLLRATAARDSLEAALARDGGGITFTGHAITWALASLDRPPCADSASGKLEEELIRIVIQCGPQSMNTARRYRESSTGDIWSFDGETWRLSPGTPADTATKLLVSGSATVAPDNRRAEVKLSTWCGQLCAEGWTYRLMLSGGKWRVVGGVMNVVS